MANRWHSDEMVELFELQRCGLTAAQIAKLMDRSVASVQLKLSRAKDTDVSLISIADLADQIGMIRNNLNVYLRKSNIKPELMRNREHYFKIDDIQNLMDNGFALICIIQNRPKKNRVWNMIYKSLARIEDEVTTRNKICESFGVFSSVVGYWINKSGFPKPIMNINTVGHIFNSAEVEQWAKTMNKTHGSLKISVADFTQNHLLDGESNSHTHRVSIMPITMFVEEGV